MAKFINNNKIKYIVLNFDLTISSNDDNMYANAVSFVNIRKF